MTTEKKLYDALMVLLNDGGVVEHLAEFDRMALRQAREAVIEYEAKQGQLLQVLKDVLPFIGYEGEGALEAADQARAAIKQGERK